MPAGEICVEVAFARPDRQALIALRVPEGSDVERALLASGIYDRFPSEDLANAPAGIWGRIVPRSHKLSDGDRIELYRPLRMDPREARRRRAEGS